MGRYLRWSVVVVGVGVRWSCRLLWFAVVRLGFSAIYYCRGQWSVALGQPIYLRGSRPQRAAAARPPHCRVLQELVPFDIIGELRRTRRLFASSTPKMRSPAANSASINPAASPQSFFLGVLPSPSCPCRAATPAGVCAAQPSRASLVDPNAPSTTPCRSVVVLHGRPTEGGGPPRIAKYITSTIFTHGEGNFSELACQSCQNAQYRARA